MVLEALESVRQQQYHGMEIILVDDGSDDNTQSEVGSLFPEVKQVRLNGEGPGAARNAGVSTASGEILMFLDSDDIWLGNHVQQLLAVFTRGFKVAYGVALTQDEVSGGDFLIPENGSGLEGDCFSSLLRWCFLVPSAMALHRNTFREIGGFDTVAHGEDWTFFLKLGARYPFGFAGPEPITLRRLHHGSLCFLRDRKNLLVIINQVLRVLENEPRATATHHNHFRMVREWTAANLDRWATVQDWYQAMKMEKII
jgi:glycosyltransferase involved in cell wall biosynthesis